MADVLKQAAVEPIGADDNAPLDRVLPSDVRSGSPESPSVSAVSASFREGSLLQYTDGQLAAMSTAGETAAYAELVNRYQVVVRNVAKSMVQDFQDAEDLTQETFIKAFNSLNSLKDTDKFSAWLFTILRHTVLDYLRSTKHMVSLENLLEDGFEPRSDTPEDAAAGALESHEEDLRTLQVLQTLREDYREVIVLKHVEKLSYKQIAKRLNMSVSAVGEKLSRVRALLKRRIEKQPIKPRTEDSAGGSGA